MSSIIRWVAIFILRVQDEMTFRKHMECSVAEYERKKAEWIQRHSKVIHRERAIALLQEQTPPTFDEVYNMKVKESQ